MKSKGEPGENLTVPFKILAVYVAFLLAIGVVVLVTDGSLLWTMLTLAGMFATLALVVFLKVHR